MDPARYRLAARTYYRAQDRDAVHGRSAPTLLRVPIRSHS